MSSLSHVPARLSILAGFFWIDAEVNALAFNIQHIFQNSCCSLSQISLVLILFEGPAGIAILQIPLPFSNVENGFLGGL